MNILIDQSWASVECSQITLSRWSPRSHNLPSFSTQMLSNFSPFLPSYASNIANSHLRASVNYKPTDFDYIFLFSILFASSRYSLSAVNLLARLVFDVHRVSLLRWSAAASTWAFSAFFLPSTQIPSNRSRCCCARCNQIKMNKSLKYEMRCCLLVF